MKNMILSERMNLFDPNIYIQFFAEITGHPPVDALVLAVNTAFLTNEATMSKIRLEKDGTAFYENMNASGCCVSVVEKDNLTLLRENENIPFQIDRGELMRVFINPFCSETSLFIIAHHLIGDGKSLTYFLEDIMNALSGRTLAYKPLHLITGTSFPEKSKIPFFFRLHADSFNRKWKTCARCFSWDDYYHIHKSYWSKYHSNVIFEAFSPEEVHQIQISAKQIGVSLNSLIAATFLKSNLSAGCLGMAVDARPGNNRAMFNQATGISVDYSYSEKLNFAKNARNIHKKIYRKLKAPIMKYFILQYIPLFSPTLLDSILFYTHGLYENKVTGKLAKVMGYKGGQIRELGITNLTRLNIPDTYGSYGLRNALFIPPVVSYAKHIIGIVTMGDEMRISYHFMSGQDENTELAFFQQGIQNIRNVMQSDYL